MPRGGVTLIRAENAQGEDENKRRSTSCDFGRRHRPRHVRGSASAGIRALLHHQRVGRGTGLGLAQVYGFAQQSAGRVKIASEVGSGTTVTLPLPRLLRDPVAPKAVEAADEPARFDATRRGHALLVEDDKEVSELTRELLDSLGFTVTHVASAGSRVERARRFAPHRHRAVRRHDAGDRRQRPGTGARDIRRRHPEIPVVLTTGYVESVAGMNDGEFDVLLKPFSGEALAQALGGVR